MPSVHISANDLAESAAECRLAHMLYEVPIGADGVFHGEAFAASGADVEMLERDMNVTAPFMGSRNWWFRTRMVWVEASVVWYVGVFKGRTSGSSSTDHGLGQLWSFVVILCCEISAWDML